MSDGLPGMPRIGSSKHLMPRRDLERWHAGCSHTISCREPVLRGSTRLLLTIGLAALILAAVLDLRADEGSEAGGVQSTQEPYRQIPPTTREQGTGLRMPLERRGLAPEWQTPPYRYETVPGIGTPYEGRRGTDYSLLPKADTTRKEPSIAQDKAGKSAPLLVGFAVLLALTVFGVLAVLYVRRRSSQGPTLGRRLASDSVEVRQQLAQACTALSMGDHRAAIAEFTNVLLMDPNNTDAYVNRSYAFSRLGEFEKAIDDCNKAIAIDPKHAGAFGNRAVANAMRGNFPSAIGDYDIALELDPKLLPALCGRGSAHMACSHHALAIADFTRALEVSPSNTEALFNRGIVYLNSAQLEQAQADFTETLRLEPAHVLAAREREFVSRVLAFRELESRPVRVSPGPGAVPIAAPEAATRIRRCIRACREIDRYRTTLVVRDLRCKELEPHAFELIRWRAEISSAEAAHIYQSSRVENFPNGADDEWVRVGTRQFQKFGNLMAYEGARPSSAEIEAFLRVERYANLLDSITPSNVVLYADSENDCLIAVCPIALTTDLGGGCTAAQLRSCFGRWLYHMVVQIEEGAFLELPYGKLWSTEPWGLPPQVAPGTSARFILVPTLSDRAHSIAMHHDLPIESPGAFQLTLWIDSARHCIIRTAIEVIGQLANGEPVTLGVEHAFGNWGEDVVVKEPLELLAQDNERVRADSAGRK
jgi:tetratricopeptide (TPR) repeat protein